MKKFFLIATAVYLLLLSIVGILTYIINFVGLKNNSMSPGLNSVYIMTVIWIPLIIWLIVTGIGLLKTKNWARYSILAMSVIAILSGIIITIILAFSLFSSYTSSFMLFSLAIILLAFIPTLIFLIILPIIYLIFFTRRSVKELFISVEQMPVEGQTEFKEQLTVESIRPVGISILSVLSVIGGITILLSIFSSTTPKVLVCGVLITGISIKIYQVLTAIISFYIGYGFWKLQKPAWIISVIYYGFSVLSSIISTFCINEDLIKETMPQASLYSSSALSMFRVFTIFGAVISIVFLIYIIVKKRIFFESLSELKVESSIENKKDNSLKIIVIAIISFLLIGFLMIGIIFAFVMVPRVGVIKNKAKEAGIRSNMLLLEGITYCIIDDYTADNDGVSKLEEKINEDVNSAIENQQMINPITGNKGSVLIDSIELGAIVHATIDDTNDGVDIDSTWTDPLTNSAGCIAYAVYIDTSVEPSRLAVKIIPYGEDNKRITSLEKTINQ